MLTHSARADPSWTWQPADTSALTYSFVVGTVGFVLSLAVLGCSVFEHLRRCEGRGGEEDVTEATLLLEHKEDKVVRPRWRIIALVFVGLSPLGSCVLVGESLGNVLFAMVAMHWICMLVFPALYCAIRSHEEDSFAATTLAFYKEVWNKDLAGGLVKSLRGCVFGVPIFMCLATGYVALRCKTFGWHLPSGERFCMRKFDQPLEEFGFKQHSMLFRLLAAFYFTFWNPAIEEFFWRVFLHREMSSELGLEAKAASEMHDAPWKLLWRDAKELLPSWPVEPAAWTSAAVCWGVSLMYASYHTWPMKIVFHFNHLWWLHVLLGFFFLVLLGRFLLLLRESPGFGLPAAYAVHAWIDAAFALLCLFEIHPEEVIA